MCEAAMWTKQVDIFMVNESEPDLGQDGGADDERYNYNDEGNYDNDYRGNGSDDENDDRNDDNDEVHEHFPEEARVEQVVSSFVDEELNDGYLDTQVSSYCKAQEYVRCKKGRMSLD